MSAPMRAKPPRSDAPAPALRLRRKCACGQHSAGGGECEECKKKGGLQRKAAGPSDSFEAPHEVHDALQSPGQPLAPETRDLMESRLGHDFSRVRVHSDARAAESAQAVDALAYTVGSNIVFGDRQYRPVDPSGQRLLAHELVHVIQQEGTEEGAGSALTVGPVDDLAERQAEAAAGAALAGPTSASFGKVSSGVIQRRVNPEDMSGEMVGHRMEVIGPFTSGTITLKGGEQVDILAWSNNSPTVRVQLPAPYLQAHQPFDLPKRQLRPISSVLAPYSTDIDQVVRNVEGGEKAIQAEKSRKGGPRPGEVPRLEGLQMNREKLLNKRLIQEEMFNHLDPIIKQWVDHYNKQFGFKGNKALDPDLVKSMLFQESQLGTSGQHLELAPRWAVRSRFNVGQVIDSSAEALLIMMKEMNPALITNHHLQSISQDLSQAKTDLKRLRGQTNLSAADQDQLNNLLAIENKSQIQALSFGETFMWDYKAAGQSSGFADAVNDLFTGVPAGQPKLSNTYDFWVRTAVRWLFEKHKSVTTWEEAVRAYNGSGADAQRYKSSVVKREKDAESSQSSGSSFVPSGI